LAKQAGEKVLEAPQKIRKFAAASSDVDGELRRQQQKERKVSYG
jgi:hypothetical protein